jgi:Flp pilus assembly protein TadG
MRRAATARREHGQVLAVIILFMVSLLGACALVIDLGNAYYQRQSLRAAADAGALAGVANLPTSQSAATSAANAQFDKNAKGGDVRSSSVTQNFTAGDSVTVTATRQAPSFFARIFGHDHTTITVTARATIESYTTYASTGNVMPFGVMKGTYTPGTSYTIYGDGSSSNSGALSLDLKSGSSCGNANGANDFRNTINGGSIACPVSVGQAVDTKPGSNTGPVAQGLNTRMSSGWQTFSQIVQVGANGQYTVLDPDSPQLVVVPIVTNLAGGTTWPNGSSQVRVVGFAYFVITGCGSPSIQGNCKNSDGKYVNGTFVGLVDTATAGSTTGAWNPTSSTASTIQLTG